MPKNFNNSICRILFSAIFFSCAVFGNELTVDRERLENIVDDTPLARSEDRAGWDYLFEILRSHTEMEIEKIKSNAVGFTELSRQPVEYRGRWVRITGQLVRCEFIPLRRDSQPFEEETKDTVTGFYESWIIVNDKKNVPIAVCSLEKPEKFPLGDSLSETVTVTGLFYKRRLFLSSGDEEVTTPTILAKNFRWTPMIEKPQTKESTSMLELIRNNTVIAFALLFVLWFTVRFFSRYWMRPKRKPIEFRFSDSIKKDDSTNKNTSSDTENLTKLTVRD